MQENSALVAQIQEVFLAVRPMVASHGGNIEFVKFEEGMVYVRLEGACVGCPSSFYTLTFGLEQMLKEKLPEVQGIMPISE